MAKVAVRRSNVLPRNLLKSAGTVKEDFETANDWTLISGTAMETDTVNVVSGAGALKLTSNSDVTRADKVISWLPGSDYENMRLSVYVDPSGSGNIPRVVLFVSSVADLSKNMQYQSPATGLHIGWNTLNIRASDWNANGGELWSNIMIRMRVHIQVSGIRAISFDELRGGITARGAVLMTFDDTYPSVANYALPYMASRNMLGTAYMTTNLIDLGGYATAQQLQALANAGWTVGQHTASHQNLVSANYDQAGMEAELAEAIADMDAIGLTAHARHLSYPHGAYDATTLAAMAGAGMLTSRTTENGSGFVMPNPAWYQMCNVWDCSSITPLESVTSWLSRASTRGEVVFLMFHNLGDSLPAWFTDIVDAVVASGLPTLTVAQLQALRYGAVAVTLPS